MKLQKRLNRKVGDKEYSKWVVVLPSDEVEKLGWIEGLELEANPSKDELILKPKKVKKSKD